MTTDLSHGYLLQDDGRPHTAESFGWIGYVAQALGTDDPTEQSALLRLPKVRRTVTRADPLMFALVYFQRHLAGPATKDQVTFSDAHLGWARTALSWLRPVDQPREHRVAEFAPRETGKTTWWFLIIPMWAAAHGHARFVAAFADTYEQSVGHLRTFRGELAMNALIRQDYGGLVHTTRNTEMRALIKDNESLLITADAFVFAARGADTSSLGLKVGEKRPDLIILDDIEPHEGKYGLGQVTKRRDTITDAILPLNERARVVWVGTTTRHGGLAHQLVELANGTLDLDNDDHAWVTEQKFTARRWPPIVVEDDGRERSIWPAKWTMDYLNSVRGTRSYAKNMDNQPLAGDGDYWSKEDIQYISDTPTLTKNIIVLDPKVSESNKESDWTGVCVAGLDPLGRVVIQELTQVRLTGQALVDYTAMLLGRFPLCRRVVIECNQGVSLWLNVFGDFPIPVDLVTADFPKEVRAGMALAHYQHRPARVVHARPFRAGEAQMISFPDVTHDDMVDADAWAVRYLLEPATINRPKGFQLRRRPRAEVQSYV